MKGALEGVDDSGLALPGLDLHCIDEDIIFDLLVIYVEVFFEGVFFDPSNCSAAFGLVIERDDVHIFSEVQCSFAIRFIKGFFGSPINVKMLQSCMWVEVFNFFFSDDSPRDVG